MRETFSLAQSLSFSLTLSNKHTEFLTRYFSFYIAVSFFMFPNFKFKRLTYAGNCSVMLINETYAKKDSLTDAHIYLARQK